MGTTRRHTWGTAATFLSAVGCSAIFGLDEPSLEGSDGGPADCTSKSDCPDSSSSMGSGGSGVGGAHETGGSKASGGRPNGGTGGTPQTGGSSSGGASGAGGTTGGAGGSIGGSGGALATGGAASGGAPTGGVATTGGAGGTTGGAGGACTACPAGCADLASDPQNCGSCSTSCGEAGSTCASGHCTRCVFHFAPYTTTPIGTNAQAVFSKSCFMDPGSQFNMSFCSQVSIVPTATTNISLGVTLNFQSPATGQGGAFSNTFGIASATTRLFAKATVPQSGFVVGGANAFLCQAGSPVNACSIHFDTFTAKNPTLVFESTTGAIALSSECQ